MIRAVFYIILIAYATSCHKSGSTLLVEKPDGVKAPAGMVWVPGKRFLQGGVQNDTMALDHEKPAHEVEVDGFFIDATEVTNAQFKKFIAATGYITTAERPVDWEELKKSVPPGTPKPADSLLLPGSLRFKKDVKQVTDLNDYSQWWQWVARADWKHPQGPESGITGKDNYPVVQLSYQDMMAYCKWAGRRLPTEAEWELAACGTLDKPIFTWGNDFLTITKNANTWQGKFPVENKPRDGYTYIAPVKSYPPNTLGIYDMAGNVWEYTSDWYNVNYYQELATLGQVTKNPQGAAKAYDDRNPYEQQKIIKGGSFLCNASYCASFRISARMAAAPDSGSDHAGFRTVATVQMLPGAKVNKTTAKTLK